MKALIAFESVVRLRSVTAAADELFVTHGAISKQIATLEDWVGRPLFQKNRKHMLPTDEAIGLAAVTDQALALIAEAVDGLRDKPGPTILRVLAPSTFAMRWLIPRLWSFSEEHAEISVELRQTHSLETWQDIPFDVAIRFDPVAPKQLVRTPFLEEQLSLALSPRLMAKQQFRGPSDLLAKHLLSAATRAGELEAWLEAAGIEETPHRATSFPHFYLALEAALAGMGALVCPLETLGDLLARGDLIEPWPEIRVAGPSYVAFHDPNSPQARAARTFVSWLASTRRSSSLEAAA